MMLNQTTTRFAGSGSPSGHPLRWLFSPRRVVCFFIQVYRRVLSPAQVFLFGGQAGCRFTPTCSQYAIEAIEMRGVMAGGVLAMKRICRCHPFGGCGHDPVPMAFTHH
jgi:putative membrane protein insertion efficiency factor